MSEIIWRDRFTGTRYVCGPVWLDKVRQELVAELSDILGKHSSLKGAADAVGRFWKHQYYERLFPLRFGRQLEKGILQTVSLLDVGESVNLDDYAQRPLRKVLLDSDHLSPIFPDPKKGKKGWLLADRLLVEAALLNVLLMPNPTVSVEERHAARLAALTYPFYDQLAKKSNLLSDEVVKAVKVVLDGGEANLVKSDKLLLETVQAVRAQVFGEEHKIRLVMVAAQRIKQYVFDTPGLNEIRGGSTLLEQITGQLRQEVEQKIGPEVVLRAAGSALVFLAPTTSQHAHWPEHLRRTFWKLTGTAFSAAVATDVPAQSLLKRYGNLMQELHHKIDIDRAQAKQASFVTLPFETRCDLCQTRAAEGWDPVPGEQRKRPLCRVCKSKRQVGQKDRYVQINKMLRILGHKGNAVALGVKLPENSERKKKESSEWVADDLSSLIASGVRRSLLGVVYGDGNNFGAVAIKLKDIALGLQWTARVEHTTLAAAALSLGEATQQGAKRRGWQADGKPVLDKIPFQVLALGGDDISLFAWAPVAVHFAAEFTRLTDLEFEAVGASCLRLSTNPLTFSLGVLVTDSNTPVVKSVHFAEHDLLGWAKKVAKGNKYQEHLKYGTIAMLYAPTAESVPADLKRYRKEMYLLGAGANLKLCTTLHPYLAEDLQMLLKIASDLVEKGHLGRFQRLVGAFYGARQSAMVGLLHYAYQRSRAASEGWLEELEQSLMLLDGSTAEDIPRAVLVKYPEKRLPLPTWRPFGLPPEKNHEDKTNDKPIWFSPLWDVFELAKLMS